MRKADVKGENVFFSTSVEEDVFQFVCFSVCLLAKSHKTTVRIFMKILLEKYLWTRK